jgi:competence protein ComEA
VTEQVEDGLVRLENWVQDRRSLVSAVAVGVIVACLGWWLVAPSGSSVPIEDLIATVDDAPIPTTPVGASPGPEPAGSAGEVQTPEASDPSSTEKLGADMVVHVVGAVVRPGLVTVGAGARVGDAVDAAGGLADAADVELLNLAEPVVDGMQIRVPTVADPPVDRDQDASAGSTLPLIRHPTTTAPTVDRASSVGPVDINRAGSTELQTLPGIGPALAAAIVTWRDEQGPFRSVDDLELVPGIGPVKLAGLRDAATV